MKNINILGWLVIVYAFIVVSGFNANVNMILSALTVCLTGVILFLTKFNFQNEVLKHKPVRFMMLFFVMVVMSLYITNHSSWKYVLNSYSLFFPVVLFAYYKERPKDVRAVFKILLLMWLVIGVRAIWMYASGAYSAREMARHMVSENIMIGGGYGFGIASALFFVYLLEMALWKKIPFNFLTMVFLVVLFLVVLETKSTITILAMLAGFLCAVILKWLKITSFTKMNVSQAIWCIILLLLVGIFFVFRQDVGEMLIKSTQGNDDIVARRILEIGKMLAYGTDSAVYNNTDMASRFSLLKDSIKTFLKYPLFGAISMHGTNFYALKSIGVGGHGEFLDALGTYGILGALPYIGMFISSFHYERSIQREPISFGYIITFAIMFFFNPFLFSQSNLVLFLMIPMTTLLFNSQEVKKKLS